MYKNQLFLCLIVAYLGSIYCEIYDVGLCPSGQPLQTTNGSKTFFGKWYEIARVDSGLEEGLKCVTFEISPDEIYKRGHSMIQVVFYNYVVIEADYDSHAVVLACSFYPVFGYWFPFVLIRIRTAWILSRTPTLDAGLQSKLIDTLADHGVGEWRLTFNSVENCPASYF